MSTTFEPARTNYPNTTFDALKLNTKEVSKSIIRSKKVIQFHIQKKNKQAVASCMSKTIKESFDAEMLDLIESYNSVQLTSAIRNSFSNDSALSIRDTVNNLPKFDFNTSSRFDKTVMTKVFVKGGSHNGYVILHVPAFVPANELTIPDEATNFKISARLISISDFTFSKEFNAYIPVNIDAHGLFGSFHTTMLPVLRMQTQPITTQICINKCKPLESGVGTVLVVAVKFYNYDQGKFVHLSDSGTMKIMKVF
ncbi:hypothetical protein [Reichenbachiella sp. MALMAid0571]|uniref:hypothetical protein n=1 Tax=Reichenbachiella sp. MALMAid0571 TaxID=3143939 RepID=UPI0032DF6D05